MKKQLILEDKLILEINRQRELMGIKPMLLNEDNERIPFLNRITKWFVDNFPNSSIEHMLGGNAKNVIEGLEKKGITTVEQLLKYLDPISGGLTILGKDLNKDLIKSIGKKIFTDSQFSNIAREAIGDYFSRFKGSIKLPNGSQGSFKDGIEMMLKIDLKKNPEFINDVELIFNEIRKSSGLPEYNESIQFIRKEIDASKSGLRSSANDSVDGATNTLDNTIHNATHNTVGGAGVNTVNNTVNNDLIHSSDLSYYITKLNYDEIIQKIKRSGLKYADEIAVAFTQLTSKNETLVGDEAVFFSSVMRATFPQSTDRFIQTVEQSIIKAGDAMGNDGKKILDEIKLDIKNPNTDIQAIDNYLKGIGVSNTTNPEFIQLWRDKLNNVSINKIITIPGSVFKNEWKNTVMKIKNGSMSFLDGIGNFFKSIGIGFIEHKGPIGWAFKRAYNAAIPEVDQLKTQAMNMYESIYNKIKLQQKIDVSGEQSKLLQIYYKIGKRKDEAIRPIIDDWMETLKKESGSEGQDYSLFFEEKIPGPNGTQVDNKFYWKKWTSSRYKEVMQSYERLEGIDQEIHITVSKADGFARMWSRKLTNGADGYRIIRFAQRLFNTALAWTPNTFTEIIRNIQAMGFANWLGKGVGQKLYMALFIIGPLLAAQRTLFSFMVAGINKRRRERGEKIMLDSDFMSWHEKDVANLLTDEDKNYYQAMAPLFWQNLLEIWKGGVVPWNEVETWSPGIAAGFRSFNSDFNLTTLKQTQVNTLILGDQFLKDIRTEMARDPNFAKICDSAGVLNIPTFKEQDKKVMDSINVQIMDYNQFDNNKK